MDYSFDHLEEATFINRDNRFRAEIEVKEERFKAHVPNSGRMKEILIPGNKVWVKKVETPLRKTPYDLLLVETQGEIICLNSHLANTLFEVWLSKGKLIEFEDIIEWKREVTYGKSRIDFLVKSAYNSCLVEVKSVNLVVEGQGKFPDAPTQRGRKHLEELSEYKKTGQRAAVVFIVMRGDALSFSPNDITDPQFGDTLRKVVNKGVEIYVYKISISTKGINFLSQVPVSL